jgi:hypothetical protein
LFMEMTSEDDAYLSSASGDDDVKRSLERHTGERPAVSRSVLLKLSH